VHLICLYVLKARTTRYGSGKGNFDNGHDDAWMGPVIEVPLIPFCISKGYGRAPGDVKERHDWQFVLLTCGLYWVHNRGLTDTRPSHRLERRRDIQYGAYPQAYQKWGKKRSRYYWFLDRSRPFL
jgi:hypothetical protein